MTRHVDFLVHTPRGTPAFALAEAFLEAVSEAEVDERPWRIVECGADPAVDAMKALAQRPGDPDVLSTCTPLFVQAPLLRSIALTHRALTPLSRLVADRYLLVVRADAPWSDAAGFLAAIAAKPTRTAAYFKGGINHLLAIAIGAAAHASIACVIVGSDPLIFAALARGEIDFATGVAADVLPSIRSGAFRALAVLDAVRQPTFADVPTLRECGADVTFKLWRGVIGPPGLASPDMARWHAIIAGARQSASWQAYLATNAQTDDPLEGVAFGRFLDHEWAWYDTHLRLAGLLPEGARA